MLDEPLKFPRDVRRRDSKGRTISEEYIIPMNAKKKVLELLYPFVGVPALEEERYDLHEGKRFVVIDFKVVRENGVNYLVSPFYYKSGGTVIDWMPPDFYSEEEPNTGGPSNAG